MIDDVNDDEFVSEEDSLLFSVLPGPRIFTLNNVNSTTMLGVLLEETEDSFLVGLPSRLIDSEAGLKIDPFMSVPYMRLIKNSVLSVLYPFGVFKEKYIPYLIEQGPTIYPEIADILKDISVSEIPDTPKVSENLEKSEISGMDQEELKEYLTEKYNNGEITYGNGTKH